jgi:hypothetical protein
VVTRSFAKLGREKPRRENAVAFLPREAAKGA